MTCVITFVPTTLIQAATVLPAFIFIDLSNRLELKCWACTIKHYGFVIYGRLHGKLVPFDSNKYTKLAKQTL